MNTIINNSKKDEGMKALVSKIFKIEYAFAIIFIFSNCENAQSNTVYEKKDWVLGLNASRVFTSEDLRSASAGGQPIPNSNLSIDNDTTVSFDISYFVSDNVAINLFGGVPASAKLKGEDSISGLLLGETDYGPLILSLQYLFPKSNNFSPYVGLGIGRILFLNETDRALTSFDIEDTWAPAAQAGIKWKIDSTWSASFDVRYVPFKVDISGNLGPAPVEAEVEVNPTILSFGISYLF